MDQKLYLAAMKGRPEIVLGKNPDYFSRQVTPQGNTALHIAARFGHSQFARAVIDICPSLLAEQNGNGDTPLHVAARGGHLNLVKILTGPRRALSKLTTPHTVDLDQGRRSLDELLLCRLRNSGGDTPLHGAVKNRHSDVSVHMLDVDPQAASMLNGDGESPLFIAAGIGLDSVVERMLNIPCSSFQGRMGMNALHRAALTGFTIAGRVVKLLIKHRPELIKQIDERGRTPLHYAAMVDSVRTCDLLLKEDRSVAYISDKNGFTAFMIAISVRRLDTALKILDHCPDCAEIRDIHGRNALHLSLKCGKTKSIESLLDRPELKELINEADDNGNTPLHLATKYRYYRAAKTLIGFKGVDLNARNNAGLTPMDLVEADWALSFRQRNIWRALDSKHATRSQLDIDSPHFRGIFNHPDADLKSMANTISVVAALLATITFAAAFTMPGGYSTDGQSQGSAILSSSSAFKAFIIADAAALCCSITVVFNLIWALVGDPCFLMMTLLRCWLLLRLALLGTVIAFVTAVYAILSTDSEVLAITVCIFGCSVPFIVWLVYYIASIASPYHRLWLEKKPAHDETFHPSQSNDYWEQTANGCSISKDVFE